MDFLGVGVPEFLFILIIALIVLGPRDMVKVGRTLGKYMRKIVTSPSWKTVQQASNEIRTLPNKLMREAGLEELRDQLPDTQTIGKGIGYADLQNEAKSISKQMAAWTTTPKEAGHSPKKEVSSEPGDPDYKESMEFEDHKDLHENPSEHSE